LSNIIEDLYSALQKGGNVIGLAASLEIESEWMFGQCKSRLVLIGLQGRLPKYFKTSES
jgi:hypothetical protein